ncbi:type II secretion system protein GspJ [Geobacter sp. AOG1]|uniref:type II secretion system protein GspJ n=1 Tax=Geobacter sp. AOG1 TaxID=1566346 RepID=UPI001CC4AB88|nr:type II secretion system protein GspJ [Geobacter sp. AOG1]GFE57255.1 general secretion pathway protein GspJ [Geobacter sp. AOG1]
MRNATTRTVYHTKPQRRNGGFTLLELLVALALLTVLFAALYGTFFALTRGRDAATSGMETRRELRTTLDQVRRELSGAFIRGPAPLGVKPLVPFVVEDRDSFGKPASTLTFTTFVPPRSDSAPTSDQVTVRYRIVEHEKRLELTREAQDRYLAGTPVPYPQMEDVEGFLVECYDGSKWVRSWDTTPGLNSGLPKAVRVTIRLKEGEEINEFSTIATPRVTGK